MPDQPDDDLVPPLKVMRKRLNGVYRAENGFSGPTRRYVLIVALLVGLASVPTLAAITVGSNELADGTTDTMDVPFLPPASPGPIRGSVGGSGFGSSSAEPSSSGPSSVGPSFAGAPSGDGSGWGGPPSGPSGGPPFAPAPGVLPPAPGASQGADAGERAGRLIGSLGERLPRMSGAKPRDGRSPKMKHDVPDTDKSPSGGSADDPSMAAFPALPGMPTLPRVSALPGMSRAAKPSRSYRPASADPASGNAAADDQDAGADDPDPGSSGDGGSEDPPTPGGQDKPDDPDTPDDPDAPADQDEAPAWATRPYCHERGKCGARPSHHHRPDWTRHRQCGNSTHRAHWSHHRTDRARPVTVHLEPTGRHGHQQVIRSTVSHRSPDRSEHRRRSAVAESPQNVRPARILERSYTSGGHNNRRLIPEARNQDTNRPYHGSHRADSHTDETAAQQRDSRVGRHHAEPTDDLSGRW